MLTKQDTSIVGTLIKLLRLSITETVNPSLIKEEVFAELIILLCIQLFNFLKIN